ncbi:BlaI/MecI/CopY family transcriptional regulator [Aurantiacibacter gangjinensis]|uniref:CopY family transcriptional repressor n=1 Tax=Aurantiacibacter gangjinensis TaxID=502682 RepID=A0A0G9MQ97_9SPHN|nr:BlaI/MecI/CopY family transcriptional regulator [Aurantiacibacter gangjinensis]APE28540.1 Transcriptional repressor, BlaI/MecI family [Aurantiacibacter gangjinensis]KLE32739.1 CopY family transcriptional repressor [Aurantiacibacter gangjinensis]
MPTKTARGADAGAERISDAEYAVMEALWKRSPQTAAEVCDTVCAERGWSIPTVKTLLSRLVQKNALATEPDGRRYLYTPLIERSAYVGTESKRMVERLFGGKAASLLAHLAQEEALSADDIAEIERLLEEMKK